jgi:hypothetical protein
VGLTARADPGTRGPRTHKDHIMNLAILLLILALLVGGLGFVFDLVVLGLALGVVLLIASIVTGRRGAV